MVQVFTIPTLLRFNVKNTLFILLMLIYLGFFVYYEQHIIILDTERDNVYNIHVYILRQILIIFTTFFHFLLVISFHKKTILFMHFKFHHLRIKSYS